MQWTDRIRQVKILLVLAAVIIAVASLVVSHALTKDLENEERNKMEVWAQAMRSLNNADENTDLSLVLKVLNENNTIPVIVMDRNSNVTEFRNLDINEKNYADSLKAAEEIGKRLKASGRVIRISLDQNDTSSDVDVATSDVGDSSADSGDTTSTRVTDPSKSSDYIDVVYDDSLMLSVLLSILSFN